jgi:hypothetical protein
MKRAADVVNVVRRAINIGCRIVGKPQDLANVARNKKESQRVANEIFNGLSGSNVQKKNLYSK